MMEKLEGGRQIFILNDPVPPGSISIIFTCVICNTNFLEVREFNEHNFSKHHSLLSDGYMDFKTENRSTHISVACRDATFRMNRKFIGQRKC